MGGSWNWSGIPPRIRPLRKPSNKTTSKKRHFIQKFLRPRTSEPDPNLGDCRKASGIPHDLILDTASNWETIKLPRSPINKRDQIKLPYLELGGDLELWASFCQGQGRPQMLLRTPCESLCNEIFKKSHRQLNKLLYMQNWGAIDRELIAGSVPLYEFRGFWDVSAWSCGCLKVTCMKTKALFICVHP